MGPHFPIEVVCQPSTILAANNAAFFAGKPIKAHGCREVGTRGPSGHALIWREVCSQ